MRFGSGCRFVTAGLTFALVVGACGSSNSGSNNNNNGGNNGGGNGTSLTSGLSSNLDKLKSYKFSYSVFGSGSGATAVETGSFAITGVVVNQPAKAISVNYMGTQFVQVGTQAWTSYDGQTWYVADSSTDVSSLLPTKDYAQWFDSNATGFQSAGDETKNGIACVHYKGDSSLSGLYANLAGVSANFVSDLWVAKDGNYPVSGAYGFSATSNGQTGGFGYKFDITDVNSSSNSVTAPTNVVALPS